MSFGKDDYDDDVGTERNEQDEKLVRNEHYPSIISKIVPKPNPTAVSSMEEFSPVRSN